MLSFQRDERQKFIRLKYSERLFYVPEEASDGELKNIPKNRPPGEDEDELFNDSAEVGCWIDRFLSRTIPTVRLENLLVGYPVDFVQGRQVQVLMCGVTGSNPRPRYHSGFLNSSRT